jgi:hypothetical protein
MLAGFLSAASPGWAGEKIVKVADDAALRAALGQAQPGTRIQIAPGHYKPDLYIVGLKGTAAEPITIEGADEAHPPIFDGGGEAWHLPRCAYVTMRNIAVCRQSGNGINIDDGGVYDKPAHHVVLEKIHVSDIGPEGNHDAIKLSGLDDFVVRECTFDAWSGQAPDMVGCHRGLIENCTFKSKPGFSQGEGPQVKGGSSRVTVRRCLFLDAATRGVNLGGVTDAAVFRPAGARCEAQDVVVEGCTFVGGEAAVAYLSVGGVVRYNTIYRPKKWVLRILQENTRTGFPSTADGRFERNLVVFRRGELSEIANIGPHTRPETFHFADNWWYCEDRPAASRPALPAAESGGVYGIDPKLAAPERNDFRPLDPRAAAFGALAWKPQPRGQR